ncbi:transcription termination factor MTERF9, chloroplastic [Canna indica]|uniref:Transcription termination factor MTERF9, chloroplastic n=1 Tax=Canna indica TaxID=4628 RepID=A0AAQ3JR10_9LILI|nr:transcription termination factor MTERF9, chloroplastic [Canna indica]
MRTALPESLRRSLCFRCWGNRCISSFADPKRRPFFPFRTTIPPLSFRYYSSSSSLSSCEILLDGSTAEEPPPPPTDTAEVFRRWGCTDAEATFIVNRHRFLRQMNPTILGAKLQILGGLGILGSDLVRVVVSRPRFLACRIGRDLQARLDFLRTLFSSDADLLRAIIRNPTLLNYDVDRTVLPCVRLYESVGVGRLDLGRLLLCRPTVITRSSLDDEKLELLRRTPIRKGATLYKYAVTVLAISHLETLLTKISNLEKFGFSTDEVLSLFARNPNVLTLSVEKVQRNMTYIMGAIKIAPEIILRYPLLIFCNLDRVLRPRHMLGVKMEEMDLQSRMKEPAWLVRAVRMKEQRFLEVFVMCHPEDISSKLMEYYSSFKGLRRLAESSRSTRKKTFPY